MAAFVHFYCSLNEEFVVVSARGSLIVNVKGHTADPPVWPTLHNTPRERPPRHRRACRIPLMGAPAALSPPPRQISLSPSSFTH